MWSVIGALAAIVIALGTGAVLCSQTDLNCRIRSAPEVAVENYAEKGGALPTLRSDLRTVRIASGLEQPTDFDFLPDGRIVVAERAGTLRVLGKEDGRASLFLDIRSLVATALFRGLVDVTVDADFAKHPYVYVVYPVARADAPPNAPTTVRVSRFTVRGEKADPASEKVVLGSSPGPSCPDLPATSDCLPSDVDHIGADIKFAEDGTLFIATGEGGGKEEVEPNAFLAQNLDSLAGKILRVDRNGHGLEDNPFWNGDPAANRSKVWAYGFRNPFRLSLERDTGLLVAGDVGWYTAEELNVVYRGKDYGWPCREGLGKTPKYADEQFCRDYYPGQGRRAAPPSIEIKRPAARSITAGAFLTRATRLPKSYRSRYLFGDWLVNTLWLTTITGAESGRGLEAVRELGKNIGGPVAIAVGPDGSVYYLALNVGELRRITSS